MYKKSSAGKISPTQVAFTSVFPITAHSTSLPIISSSIRILVSYLLAYSIACFNSSMFSAFFIPTDEPELDGLTKTGNPNLLSIFLQI